MPHDDHAFYTTDKIELIQPSSPWARISEIAGKLDVAPVRLGGPPTITATGADGKDYDLWDVITAFLDRVDAAAAAGLPTPGVPRQEP